MLLFINISYYLSKKKKNNNKEIEKDESFGHGSWLSPVEREKEKMTERGRSERMKERGESRCKL